MNRILASFTGASGTGKTTLLNSLEDFTTIELSARPYLPKKGDYVVNKSDSINRRISYGSLVTFSEMILNWPNNNLFFSRCAIDSLAYGRVLGVGEDLHPLMEMEIRNIVIPYIKVFYIPVEFELPGDDEIRGTNEEIRKATDQEIQNILKEFDIPHTKITGPVEERLASIYYTINQ